jgi:hypothetical protein
MKKYILFLFLVFSVAVSAQELQCNISVSSKQIEGTNKDVFNTLQKGLTEFMNNRRWTDRQYAINERIECSFTIIVNEQPTTETFKAEIQVQARRPVYGSSYTTTLLNFKDQTFNFEYKEFDPIEFNDNSFDSNLTAVLAYYAYLILGLDSDSFSMYGGTPYFQKAENIVNMAQSTSESGWRAFESRRNRYEVINNIMDERLKRFREFYYQYHRLGLDEMAKNPANARARIAQSIIVLEEVNRNRPSSIALQLFFDAKEDELINIFSQGTDKEKSDMYKLLSDLNPTKSTKYEQILKK